MPGCGVGQQCGTDTYGHCGRPEPSSMCDVLHQVPFDLLNAVMLCPQLEVATHFTLPLARVLTSVSIADVVQWQNISFPS